ncbi:MAG: metallopeptidase family protein [Longimicrobiaceae bacterium]
MDFGEFERRARAVFERIPHEYREGVDGLSVVAKAQPHPTLPDVWTLGECRSEAYPSDFGGPQTTRSLVLLYHGSFERVAAGPGAFDWEEEIWQTVTHEIRHHLEWLAREDGLEVEDYVNDQNFARRAGEGFDPGFYLRGEPLAEGVYRVGDDVFLERAHRRHEPPGQEPLTLRWRGREVAVPWPDPLEDVHYLVVEGVEEQGGELVLVLRRELSAWQGLRQALLGSGPSLGESWPKSPKQRRKSAWKR